MTTAFHHQQMIDDHDDYMTVVQTIRRHRSSSSAIVNNTFCLKGVDVVEGCTMRLIVDYLEQTPTVSRLILVQTHLATESIHLLSSFFQEHQTIQRFIVSRLLVTTLEDWDSLLQSLAWNRSLQELVLHECFSTLDGRAGAVLEHCLPLSPQVTKLQLAGNPLTPLAARAVGGGAAPHMTHLNLQACELQTPHLKLLLEGLQPPHNHHHWSSTLQTLDLSHNWLEASSLVPLAQFLEQGSFKTNSTRPPSLQTLILSGNKHLFDHGDVETRTFASVLARNTSLQRLDLARCGLTDPTASSLFQALQVNGTLTELHVQVNSGIGVYGYRQLLQSFPHMKGLQILSFDALFPDFNEQLVQALWKNVTLERIQPHYGLDRPVQCKVQFLTRRNRVRNEVMRMMTRLLRQEVVEDDKEEAEHGLDKQHSQAELGLTTEPIFSTSSTTFARVAPLSRKQQEFGIAYIVGRLASEFDPDTGNFCAPSAIFELLSTLSSFGLWDRHKVEETREHGQGDCSLEPTKS